jgi:bacteriorhodopsin
MGWPKCNTTLEDMTLSENPIYHGHTFHNLGLWMSAIFGVVAVALSFFLIFMHATHYLRPYEQRHIIRILFMVPIYATVSFLSFKYYNHSVYFEVLRDCYEAFAIASFFSLLCAYLAENLHAQKEYFRAIKPRNWIWPMGWFQKCCGGSQGMLRVPRSGLTWFNVCTTPSFQTKG